MKIMSEVYTPTRRSCPVVMKTLGCAWTHSAHPIMFSLMDIARHKITLFYAGLVPFALDRAGGM